MIKRYILHIELHKRHMPRISFKQAPKHGDRVVDGGVPGTLKLCPECHEGFLHVPDPVRTWFSRPMPPGPHKWEGRYCIDCQNTALLCPYPPPKPSFLATFLADLVKNLSQPSTPPARSTRSYHRPRPAMDLNAPTHVKLQVREPAEHVELKITEPAEHVEHVELKVEESSKHVELKFDEESPETLELDYKLGKTKHKRGDILWTHKAEYVVDRLADKVLHLVRKDVWDERQKKAEHVELKTVEETPSEHVVLNFE